MAKKLSKLQLMTCISAVLVVVALILSVISSQTAYGLSNLNQIIAMGTGAVVLGLVVAVAGKKLPGLVQDAVLWITAILTSMTLCSVVSGRVLLVGYIYFSDLESSNPIAIRAMNLAIGAWVFYLLALVLTCGAA